jgi:hypothetical protein
MGIHDLALFVAAGLLLNAVGALFVLLAARLATLERR